MTYGIKLSPNIICCLHIWWNQVDLKLPKHKFHSPLCSMDKLPYIKITSYGTRHSSFLSLSNRFSSLTTHRIIQISQSHRSTGTMSPLTLDTTQPAFHSSWLYTAFPSAYLTWPSTACGVHFPPVCEYMRLTICCQARLSRNRCHMSNYHHNPRVEILSSTMG